jgi:hypothetical protein
MALVFVEVKKKKTVFSSNLFVKTNKNHFFREIRATKTKRKKKKKDKTEMKFDWIIINRRFSTFQFDIQFVIKS